METPLVLIEWEDSVQPTSNWQHKDDLQFSTVRIVSVGYLVHDTKAIKALAPNVGGIDGKATPQVSGVINIPTRCVLQIKCLHEGKHYGKKRK